MFKLLKTVLNAGDVTTKYPFKPYEVDPDFRGKPELNSDQCIVCAACTMACQLMRLPCVPIQKQANALGHYF